MTSYRGKQDRASTWVFCVTGKGASSRYSGLECLEAGQLDPAFGAEKLQRPEGALVGHLGRIGDPVAEIDVWQAALRGRLGKPEDHESADAPAVVLWIEEAVNRRH